MNTQMRLDLFNSADGMNRGAPRSVEAAWYVTKCIFFLSPLPWPSRLKVSLLRKFGAKVGTGCVIKPRVNIHMPWKLKVGDHVWIGEESFILNLEPVSLGSQSCLSQRSFLCTGNHDYRDVTFRYRNAAIVVEPGAWVGAMAFVGPGVTLGSDAVLSAGSVATKSLQGGRIYAGNFCEDKGPRWKTRLP